MEELVRYIAESLVEHPENVSVVSREEEDGTITIELSVPQSEMGKVIGRQASMRDDSRYMVEIIEK